MAYSSLECLIGLTNCVDFDPLRVSGTYVRWFEMLSLGGIILAISEFIENNRLRTYLFKRKFFAWLIGVSIIAVFVSNLLTLPLIPGIPIPLLAYPAFWELLSLFIFSLALIKIILISIEPNLFIPRFNRKNAKKIWKIVSDAIIYEGSSKSLSAITRIIEPNIEPIVNHAIRYDRNWNISGSTRKSPYELYGVLEKDRYAVLCAVRIINELLSHKRFCQYIVKSNLRLIGKLVEVAEKKHLWRSCGYFLFKNIFKHLFEDEDSLLSQEVVAVGGLAVSQPLSNKIFRAFGIISHYRIFQSIDSIPFNKLNSDILKKFTSGLEISLKEYFEEERSIYVSDTPNIALSYATKELSEIMFTICIRLRNQKEDFENVYQDLITEITFFFERLPNILPNDTSALSEEEKNCVERSLLYGLVDTIFRYLEAFSWLKNTEISRLYSTSIFWLLFLQKNNDIAIMSKKLLTKIGKRIKENKNKHYPSMCRLLLGIYGFQFPDIKQENIVGWFMQRVFYAIIANLALQNNESAQYFLPSNWKWDINNKTICTERGRQIYPHN